MIAVNMTKNTILLQLSLLWYHFYKKNCSCMATITLNIFHIWILWHSVCLSEINANLRDHWQSVKRKWKCTYEVSSKKIRWRSIHSITILPCLQAVSQLAALHSIKGKNIVANKSHLHRHFWWTCIDKCKTSVYKLYGGMIAMM